MPGRPSESTPLVGPAYAKTHITDVLAAFLPALPWACIVIVASAGMININKELMQADVFPHVFVLILLQFTFSIVLHSVLRLFCPGLYTSLSAQTGVQVSKELFRRVFPVAASYVLSIATSTLAYRYSTVPFLQMMKEANIITVYTLALALGMEKFDSSQAVILLMLVFATVLSIDGELQFSAEGMILQGIACLADATKNVLSSLLLSGIGRLDPMSFQYLLAPLVVMLVVFGLLLAEACRAWMPMSELLQMLEIPPQKQFLEHWPLIMLSAVSAFVLNLSISMFLRSATALSFGILGIIKDMLVVLSSTLLLGAPISHLQMFSFSGQILLATAWTCRKAKA